ncbi:MAG: hypothetical protein JSV52_06470 [Candidatus Zixiibacteriota bacterium]|nr:MAG: hypothetical protein JSV52_06470 [candidate division Zixibacteria bacterium]
MGQLHISQQGGALLIALGIMLLLTIAALIAVDTAQTDMELSFNQVHSSQSFYVAQAGLIRAFNEINNDNDWTAGFLNEPYEGGYYTVIVVDSTVEGALVDTVILRATGKIGDANTNLEALVVPEYWRPFQYAMFGDSAIVMDNNTCTDSYNSDSGDYASTMDLINGDVASNGDLEFIHTAVVGGDASSATEGGIFVCATCTVYGDTTSKIDPLPVPPVPDSVYDWARSVNAAPGGLSDPSMYDGVTHALNMNLNSTLTLSGGVYYFSEITIENNSRLQVAPGESVEIYVTGDISIGQNAYVNTDGDPADMVIFSDGDSLQLGMSTVVHAAFYGPSAIMTMENNCQYYGSIVAYSGSAVNAACIHYDRALREVEGGKTGVMHMIAWKEL